MSVRAHIRAATEKAALLCQLTGCDCPRLIPYEHAKAMTEAQIISLFQRDHWPIRKEDGGEDVHWNLFFRLIKAHATKTAKIDKPQSAHGKRIRADQEGHRRRMLAKTGGEENLERALAWLLPKPKHTIPSRRFPKGRKFPTRKQP
jgi:hypothetical protein